VLSDTLWHDRIYSFLQNVFRLYPEDRFMLLLKEACQRYSTDEDIYRHVQQRLPGIKPALGDLRLAMPALRKQKLEMHRQTLELLGTRQAIDGYVEIGSTGRYISALRKSVRFSERIFLVNDKPPANSPQEFLERGGFRKIGSYVPLDRYAPLPESVIPAESIDFVSCYVGLHHMTPGTLGKFVASVARTLRPGGLFVLRDHDVATPEMFRFVSLIHTIFNAGTGASWEENRSELRYFAPITDWVTRLKSAGLVDQGHRVLQPHDPSDNVLMAFSRE
jgi:SAM-dependent methyltransferase